MKLPSRHTFSLGLGLSLLLVTLLWSGLALHGRALEGALAEQMRATAAVLAEYAAEPLARGDKDTVYRRARRLLARLPRVLELEVYDTAGHGVEAHSPDHLAEAPRFRQVVSVALEEPAPVRVELLYTNRELSAALLSRGAALTFAALLLGFGLAGALARLSPHGNGGTGGRERRRDEPLVRTRSSALFDVGPMALVRRRAAPGWPVERVSENIAQFGLPAAELQGATVEYASLVCRDDRERVAQRIKRAVDQGEQSFEQEYRLRLPDGGERWVHDFTTVVRDSLGEPLYFDAYLLDIDERHVADAKLRRSRRHYHELFETNAASIWQGDASAVMVFLQRLREQGVEEWGAYFQEHPELVREAVEALEVLDVNRATLDLYQAEGKEQLLGAFSAIFTDESLPCLSELLAVLARGETQFECETRTRTLKGHHLEILLQFSLSQGDGRDRALVTMVDVTERRAAERELQHKSEQIISLLESSTDAYFAVDRRWQVGYFNGEAEHLLAVSRERLLGQELWEAVPELASFFFKRFNAAMRGQRGESFEGYYPPLDKWLETHLYPTGDGLWVFLRDVTQRRRSELALRESESRNRALLEHVYDGIVAVDPQGRVLTFNRAAEAIFGYGAEEVMGAPAAQILGDVGGEGCQAFIRQAATTGALHELVGRRRDGSEFPMEVAFSEVTESGRQTFICVIRDITEAKQRELVRRERELRLDRQHDTLFDLARLQTRPFDSEKAMLELITERAATTIDVDSVGVWLLDPDESALRCADLYRRSQRHHEHGFELSREHYGGFFRALEADRVIAVTDVDTDVRSREFSTDFLRPLDVGAMLATVIHGGGRPIGAVIYWHTGGGRHWHLDERTFAASVSDAVANALESHRRRRAESDLYLAAKVFDNATEAILVTDERGRILSVNPAFSDITGYALEEVVGRNPSMLKSGRHGPEFYRRMWEQLERRGRWQGEVWNRRKNGEVYPEWLAINRITDSRGRLTNYLAVFRDITEKKEAENRIYHLAYYDMLTGLPNRQMLQGRLEQVLAEARAGGRSAAVLYIDLDRFKNINDTFGHGRGDAVLKEVATRLIRSVGESDSVARLSGDEFAVMVGEMAQTQDAAHKAHALIDALSEPFTLEEQEVFITCSVGIATYPTDADNVDDLVKNAETAMFHAKDEGRNDFQFYRAEMNATAFERLVMENSLRRALDREEFLLYFQPQVDIESGHVIGVESLLRWQHPDLGLVSPAQFIPVLEETGMILRVGEWVLRTACAHAAAWQDARRQPVRVAVNISPLQFMQQGFVDSVFDSLTLTGLDARCLELELTEGSLMRNAEASVKALRRLKEAGIRLSIDDFGTGYSSLSYLKRFPIDTLKIDQSFVRDVTTDADDAAIASTVIAMGHSLKLEVIAEGVETGAQLDFLRRYGCDQIQGYLFSRPLPAAEMASLLQRDLCLDDLV